MLSTKLYHCEKSLSVFVKGGKLFMEQKEDGVYMTGPANLICEGRYSYEESSQG